MTWGFQGNHNFGNDRIMDVFIYSLSDPLTKEIRYVGKAVDVHQRYKKHLVRKENTYKFCWVEGLKQKGLKPELEVLEVIYDSNDKDWQASEQWWISYLRFIGCRLTNLNGGGIGGKLPSIQTRAKQSDSHKGKKLSPEIRRKMSLAKKGIPKPSGFSEKLRRANIGKKHSPETRKKLSEIGKKNFSPENHAKLCKAAKTPEAIAKIAASKRGVKQTAETISKRFANQKDWKMSDKGRTSVSNYAKSRMTPERILLLNAARLRAKEKRGGKWQLSPS